MIPEPLINQLNSLYLDAKIKQGVSQQDIDAFQTRLKNICKNSVWRNVILAIFNKHPTAFLSQWDSVNAIVTKIHTAFNRELVTHYVPHEPHDELLSGINNTADLYDCLLRINLAVRSLIMEKLLNSLEFGHNPKLRPLALNHLINSFCPENSEQIRREYNEYLQAAPNEETRTFIKKNTSKYLILIDVCNTASMRFARLYIDLNTLSFSPFLKLYEGLPVKQKQIIQLFFTKFQASLLIDHGIIDAIARKLRFIYDHFKNDGVQIADNIQILIKKSNSLQEAVDQFNQSIQDVILKDLPNLEDHSRYMSHPVLSHYLDGFETARRLKLQKAMQSFEAEYTIASQMLPAEDAVPVVKFIKSYCVELIVLFELLAEYALTLLHYYLKQSTYALHQFLNKLMILNHECAWLAGNEFTQIFKPILHKHQETLQSSPDEIVKLMIQIACLDLENEKSLVEHCVAANNYAASMDVLYKAVQRHLTSYFLLADGNKLLANVMLTKLTPLVIVGFFESLGPTKAAMVMQEYQTFVTQYEKADDHAAPEHQTPYQSFIQNYSATFLKLFHLFDLGLFPFLKSYLGTSTLKLLRFFSQVDDLNIDGMDMIKVCLSKWPAESPYEYQKLENLCIAGGSLELLLKFANNNQFPAAKIACTSAPTFSAALEVFSKFITHLTASKLRIPPSSQKLQAFPFEKLTRLLLAAKSMENNRYEEMYYAMLAADFSPSEDFNAFITGILTPHFLRAWLHIILRLRLSYRMQELMSN